MDISIILIGLVIVILVVTTILIVITRVTDGANLEPEWVLFYSVADMEKQLTLQTAAAFERVYDALMGRTEDDLTALALHLEELSRKAKEVQEVSACLISGDC
jgi:hypothetical protein